MYLLKLISKRRQQFLRFLLLVMVVSDRTASIFAISTNEIVTNNSTSATQSVNSEQLHEEPSPSLAAAAPAEANIAMSSLPPTEQSSPLSPLPAATATASATSVEQHQQHPHPKRNYASKDCGAKVLYSNAEAENRGAILNDPERDDYMRNPCERAQNKFLIIELCETIQPTALEMANFELFSSNPRQFRLWGSERYPTQEWTLIGEFEALDNREVQLFNVLEHTSYAKFVKLELLTHYGMEHYCTLSTFRLYGTSMVDEYEAETVVVVDSMQQQQLDSVFGRTFALPPPTNTATATTAGEAAIGGMDSDSEGSTATTTESVAMLSTTMSLREEGQKQQRRQRALTKQPSVVQRCSLCHQGVSPHCDWFCHTFFDLSHQNQRTTRLDSATSSSSAAPRQTKRLANPLMDFFNKISPARSAICAAASVPRLRTCSLNGYAQSAATDTKLMENAPAVEQHHNQRQGGQGDDKQQPVQQPQQMNQSPTTGAANDNKDNIINNSDNNVRRNDAEMGEQKQQQQSSETTQHQPQQTVHQLQRPMLDAKVVEKNNLSPLPGTSSTHKESVFMKLNKRLTLLEQNMSLSSEHLLELSRRCVNGAARTENELKQQREGIAKEAERMAKQEANRVETDMKQKIMELQREVRRLSQQLQSVQTTVVQATGTGGFFYRPMLSPVHGYSASDSHCAGEQACLVSDAMMSSTLPPMHSTSAAAYAGSMPVAAARSAFAGKTTDGLWTTSQVLYLMLLVQIGTFVLFKLFRVLCARVHLCLIASQQPTATQKTTNSCSTPNKLCTINANTSQHSLPLPNSSPLS